MQRRYFSNFLFYVLLVSVASLVGGQTYTISVITGLENCYGGSPCGTQPVVKLINSQGLLASNFNGSAYAQMGASPTGYEPLYMGTCGYSGNCGTKVTGTKASVSFTNGYASFQDLMVKTAGTGYTLQIIARDSTGYIVGGIYTPTYDVNVGPVFQTIFSVFVGTAIAGIPFSPNPTVAAVDRGRNVVQSLNYKKVNAYLVTSPNGYETLEPPDKVSVSFINGVAQFFGLYINQAGYPYGIGFNSSVGEGITIPLLTSAQFSVTIGQASQLVLDTEYYISRSTPQSGEYFKVGPRLKILDAGGNVIVSDSSSGASVNIYNNAGQSVLTPNTSIFATALEGVVSFSVLTLNKQAKNYRLIFTLYSYSAATSLFTQTDITALSEYFNVNFGPPRMLITITDAALAYADGQPFGIQPQLQVVDYGYNTLVEDDASIAHCKIVGSLSSTSTGAVAVLTRLSAVVNSVESVTIINLKNGTIGAGELVQISVNFLYEVFLSGTATPYLVLNVNTTNTAGPYARIYGQTEEVTSLIFYYIVENGDSAVQLDVLNSDSFIVNGTRIVDGNGRNVTTTLPSHGFSKGGPTPTKLVIDTVQPLVSGIGTTLANGEYGAGEEIHLFVNYTVPVQVHGLPYLVLSAVNSSANINDTLINSTTSYINDYRRNAYYNSTSDDGKTVFFRYVVLDGDSTTNLTIVKNTIQLPAYPESTITRKAYYAIGNANLTLTDYIPLFNEKHEIVIDTNPPVLDTTYGVRTSHIDGTFYPGEHIYLYLRFNKPVVTEGFSITLYLAAGSAQIPINGLALLQGALADEKTLEFLYIVQNTVNCSVLDINNGGAAIFIGNGAYIKRKSTHASLDANINTTDVYYSGRSLRNTAKIRLYGFAPKVSSVDVVTASHIAASSASRWDLYPDDYIIFRVRFTTRVIATCSPIVIIDSGNYFREAAYYSGNETTDLLFIYYVAIGDTASYFRYRYLPNAMCVATDCPVFTTCNIFANATAPSLSANLQLPLRSGSKALGVNVLEGNYTLHPRPLNRNTSVVTLTSTHESGNYGPGTVIYIIISFTDVVNIDTFSTGVYNYPQIYLNIGKFAQYVSGSSTTKMTFMYQVEFGDSTHKLEPVDDPYMDNSAIYCSLNNTCAIINAVNIYANLTTTGKVHFPNISLDSNISYITEVYSPQPTSPYDGFYTVGDVIDIVVVFSKPVMVVGDTARLQMNVGAGRYAYYQADLSKSNKVVFSLLILAGDYTANLTFAGTTIDLFYDSSAIYRQADIPTQAANLTLPLDKYVGRNGSIIRIETSSGVRPVVKQVVSVSPNGTYRAGDDLIIRVDFTQYVTLTGYAKLYLNLGTSYGVAKFAGVDESSVNSSTVVLPTNATKTLYFTYSVAYNDFNYHLDYVDTYSLTAGITIEKGTGYVYQYSNEPQIICSLDLPIPGQPGSLSNTSNIYVDGTAAYLTGVQFLSSPGVYTVGDKIDIAMNFSAPVIVTGIPSLLMDLGSFVRQAHFFSGSKTSQLKFRYTPVPGDDSLNLDYLGARLTLHSARSSFQYNGGSVLVYSTNPFVPVEILLSPTYGALAGTTVTTARKGEYSFLDLSIDAYGLDYLLQFYSTPSAAHRTLLTTQTLFVSFTTESSTLPTEAQNNDTVGWAVAVSGTLAAIGAPNSNKSVTTVQMFYSTCVEVEPVPEIQIFKTTIEAQPAIQRFYTTANVGTSIGGYFTVAYDMHGPSLAIPYNADTYTLEAMITGTIPELGNVTVTREPYIYCACNNAYNWTITYNEFTTGTIDLLVVDGSQLTGEGVYVAGPTRIQNPAKLGGGFQIKALNKTSSVIPYDGGIAAVQAAVTSLGLEALGVYDTNIDRDTGTRLWSVTFAEHEGSYEVPLLEIDTADLTGGVTGAWVEVARQGIHGSGGLSGGFTLEWRGNTTSYLPYNATADQVKTALESLPTIGSVNVQRGRPTFLREYKWTVEFLETRTWTPRGYVVDEIQNLEPLIAHSSLIGTNATVLVDAVWSPATTLQDLPFGPVRQGTYGEDAGAVYIFSQASNGKWYETAALTGSDTSEFNKFGTSVALLDDVLLVGAVGASATGQPEMQSITCDARSGYFQILFRGWTSDLIPYNASRNDLLDAMVPYSTASMTQLHPIYALDIKDWGESGLCANNTAVITFLTPYNGDAEMFGIDTGPALELLTVLNGTLDGRIEVKEVQQGTWRVNSANSNLQQIGGAYVFRTKNLCLVNETACLPGTHWTQEAKFYPTTPNGFDRFGWTVSLADKLAIVGSPGSNYETGLVYLYKNILHTNSSVWQYWDSFSGIDSVTGDQFGSSIAVWLSTLLVGAPYKGNTGCVYAFRSLAGKRYSYYQILTPSTGGYTLSSGDLYGYSIAMYNNVAVVGSPGRDDPSIYLGKTIRSGASNDTGSVFVFQRPALGRDFTFLQRLVPSNIIENDRFGFDVDVYERAILVGQVSKFDWPQGPSRAVVEITTSAEYNTHPLKKTFRLTWMAANESGVFVPMRTRPISYNTSAEEMSSIIEGDLNTGAVLVTRSKVDRYDGGYVWTVTFVAQQTEVVPFGVDSRDLGGQGARVDIAVIHPYPLTVRSKAHVFLRGEDAFDSPFQEEFFLTPYRRQPSDICGFSVALQSPYFAFVGCPNRDSTIPNHNTGSGTFFNISLLRLKFEKFHYNVTEGNNVTVVVERDPYTFGSNEDVLLYVQTLDRNAGYITQSLVQGIYSVANTSRAYVSTFLDTAGIVGKAVGRSQYYGSTHNESIWVDGMYDYRAISDYVPFQKVSAFLRENSTMYYNLQSTPDTILESPNETVSVIIWSPGVWPSILGRFFTSVLIEDNHNGYYDGPQYEKVYAEKPQVGAQVGYSLALNAYLQVLFTGTPDADSPDGTVLGCGTVVFYRFEASDITYVNGTPTVNSGKWAETDVFVSPAPSSGAMFGDDVQLGFVGFYNTSILLVGEPINNTVHVYSSTGGNVGLAYTYETALTTPYAYLPQHDFGAKGTIGLYNFVAVVGAPGIEAVFVFRRVFVNETVGGGRWNWTEGALLRSSQYEYDIIGDVTSIVLAGFGTSVSVSGRTLVVGAPYADYDNLADPILVRSVLNEATEVINWGRGEAFVYNSQSEIQVLTLYSDSLLLEGTFKLGFDWLGNNDSTSELTYTTSAQDLAAALMALNTVDLITVEFVQSELTDSTYSYSWTITFPDQWQEMPLVKPLWKGFGCQNCTAFDVSTSRGADKQMETVRSRSLSSFVESQALKASDAKNGNRFGWTVAIDGEQIAISAIYSSAITSTTWDFECGCLVGWMATGTAFQYQPTYGDNSRYRIVNEVLQTTALRDSGVTSRLVGFYYIGTYELRPGNSSDYLVANPDYPEGSTQGDVPQGTLTSETFMILGNSISFLVGGGCDYYVIYVELLVDGISVAKLTGQCDERMSRVSFDTSLYLNRAAQIRIVDASSGNWGHINVDDFQFDWDVRGAVVNSTYVDKGKESIGGVVETPTCGVVYTFNRHVIGSLNYCGPDKTLCEWTEETRLIASDKRADMQFGAQLAVNNAAGIVVISAPNAALTGFFKEYMSVYPYMYLNGTSNAMLFDFPVNAQNMSIFQSQPLHASNPSGAYGLWYMERSRGVYADHRPYEQAGAVYIYTRVPAVVDSSGNVIVAQYWIPSEKARIQAPDEFARDAFGFDFVLDGSTLAIGAPGQDGILNNAGAIYIYNAIFAAVSFSEVEFRVLEGYSNSITVFVNRDSSIYSGKVAIAYATSDLTAKGVDSHKYKACYALAPSARGGAFCGDYEHTAGVLVIEEGYSTGGFSVNIINDQCKSNFMKFIQVTLSVPGSAAIQGQTLQAKIRIDDDDFTGNPCPDFSQ